MRLTFLSKRRELVMHLTKSVFSSFSIASLNKALLAICLIASYSVTHAEAIHFIPFNPGAGIQDALIDHSTDEVTFSSEEDLLVFDLDLIGIDQHGIDLTTNGSFVATFSQPVISFVLDVFVIGPTTFLEAITPTTFSAVYRDAEGNIIGSDVETASFGTHDEADKWGGGEFDGSNDTPFTSVTFKVEQATGSYSGCPFGCEPFQDIVRVGVASLIYTPIPEPETYGMMLAGLGLLGLWGRRKLVHTPYQA